MVVFLQGVVEHTEDENIRKQDRGITAMLPPEITDHIVDLLYNDLETLKQCCLVSKSWVPRTRRYIFANIFFHSAHAFESWNNTFPDPTNSPASHVNTLTIDSFPEDVEGFDWITSFSCVEKLSLHGRPTVPFALFHGLSFNLRSLNVQFITFSCPDLFDFICSFPHLENLDLVCEEVPPDHGNNSLGLQTSPPLTGSLSLFMFGGMGVTLRHLLSLPNGLRFRDLVLLLVQEKDLRWIKVLIFKCSDTLECLDIRNECSGTFFGFSSGGVVYYLRSQTPGIPSTSQKRQN